MDESMRESGSATSTYNDGGNAAQIQVGGGGWLNNDEIFTTDR